MTRDEHEFIKIGDLIRKEDKEIGYGLWRVTTKHKKRGYSYDKEFYVSLEPYSLEFCAKGWSEFTLSNQRPQLEKYQLLTTKTHPEYFL